VHRSHNQAIHDTSLPDIFIIGARSIHASYHADTNGTLNDFLCELGRERICIVHVTFFVVGKIDSDTSASLNHELLWIPDSALAFDSLDAFRIEASTWRGTLVH
jgi:hypothetical protein